MWLTACQSNIKDFCSLKDNTPFPGERPTDYVDAGSAMGVKYPPTPGSGNSIMSISLSYRENSDGCPKSGPGSRYYIKAAPCERLLSRTIDDCDTSFAGSAGKFGGKIIDGCGAYSLSTKVFEQVKCEYAPLSKGRTFNFTDADIDDAITTFCNQQKQLEPSTRIADVYPFHQGGLGQSAYVAVEFGDSILPDFVCSATKDKAFEIGGPGCQRRMRKVMDVCESDPVVRRIHLTGPKKTNPDRSSR